MAGNAISQRLSDDFGTEVSIGPVRFYPVKKLFIHDLLIKDKANDTLLYVEKFGATIDSINFKDKSLYLGKITTYKLNLNINSENKKMNFQFLIDSLSNQENNNAKWKYYTHSIGLKGGSFSFTSYNNPPSKTLFNSNNVKLSNVDLLLNNIYTNNDSLSLLLKTFTCQEQSGFAIKNTKGEIIVKNHSFSLHNFQLATKRSLIGIKDLNINYNSLANFKDFIHKVPFQLNLNSLSAHYQDFAYFIPNFPRLSSLINLKGRFIGTIADLKGQNIYIKAGSNSKLHTDFDIKGLPNLSETYVYLDVNHLKTSILDIEKVMALNKKTKDFVFPKSFEYLGDIEYSGNFSGFTDNIVAYGEFKTDLGQFNTDIGFKITPANKLIYSGFLNTKGFNFGRLVNSEGNLNRVTLDLSLQGYRSSEYNFNSFLKGTIDSIDFKGYKYEKVELNGFLSNKSFDGKVTLNDPNADLSFIGKVNFKSELPVFDFYASINKVRLDKLNLVPKLANSEISIQLNSNLTGNNLNNITGKIQLFNGKFTMPNHKILVDTLDITSKIDRLGSELTIKSDLLDAVVKGHYYPGTFPKEMNKELSVYLPALFDSVYNTIIPNSNLSFEIKTKNLEPIIKAINPNIFISDGSKITGIINSEKNNFHLYGEFEKLKYKSIKSEDVNVRLKSQNHKLLSEITSSKLTIGNLFPLENFILSQQVANDSMHVNLFWNNWEDVINDGAIYTSTNFKKTTDGRIFSTVNIKPSSLTINDSAWHLQESTIKLTPVGIKVDAFRLWNLHQEINVNGTLFDSKTGDLTAYIQNLDIGEITKLFNVRGLSFNGNLNGNINIQNSYTNPIISSNLWLNELNINNEEIGDLSITSKWDKITKTVLMKTLVQKENITPLIGDGYFIPKTKDFNLDLELDSLPIGFLNLYLSKVMQNLTGTASGKLVLSTKTGGIGLDGKLNVNRAKFDVDLLKCSFSLEDTVSFTPESIRFNKMTVTDPNGRKGMFDGVISHTNFFNMNYDLYLRANNMLLLNTKEYDNPLYYGTVFGTGDLAITGTTYDLFIDINAQTEDNTRFYIPMSDKQEVLDNNFIQFVSNSNIKTPESTIELSKPEYKIDLSNFTLNMGIDITPKAQMQVIFDPTVGDLLRCTGRGNMQVKMSKKGEISFFGEYTAEEGEYLFSLENVVNKRFDINEGGTLIWEGDPYDAIIDLTATYKLKTSIQPLILPSTDTESETKETFRRVPIHCDLILGDRLSQPSIKFNISAPTMEQSTQNLIDDAINTEEELNRQVLSLLVLNRFYTPNFNASSSDGGSSVNTAAITSTSEMLSNQLSNWLSQISDDFDIGISYRPEDEISSEQVEVALSTQIFNDRVTINGNVEYGKYTATQQNSSNIVGDFDMNVKLNKSGSLRAKAYTHNNDDYSTNDSPTTQGVGISYHEEFNTFGELLRKYWNWITGNKNANTTEK
jgi:hypothetical protein